MDWQGPWMTEEHRMFQESVRKFMDKELTPNIKRWRKQGIVDKTFWKVAGNAGLLGATAPEAYGGAGADRGYDAIIAYESARTGDSGWGWAVHNICLHYFITYANEAQKQRWLPGLVSGDLVPAISMTEPGTGTDLQSIRTTAEKDGNDYVINGSKIFITNGQSADLVIVVAKTDKDAAGRGVSLIVVETDRAEGFSRGRNLEKLGWKANDTSELFYENMRVPQSNLLGDREGQGFYQLMHQLAWERLLMAIGAVGAMDGMMLETLAYVKERRVFGQRLMDMQNTRFKLAEAKTKLEVSRSYLNDCMIKLLDDKLEAVDGSMAKWWCTQMQNEVADECLQLHGGYGFMLEYPIAHYYADARAQKIAGGANEIQKELIARTLDY